MTAEDYQLLIESIQHHEGLSLHPTPDIDGSLVIGYGRNLTHTGVSKKESVYLLQNDVEERLAALPLAWKSFNDCDGPRQRALIELAFQEGIGGLLLFKNLLAAVATKNYDMAAREVLNSRLAKQAPIRARDYAEILRT